jgi:hypothetical protein
VEVGQLLAHQGCVVAVGADEDVFAGQDMEEAVVGLLQLCASGAEEVDELLGFLLTAAGPQPASLSTRKDDAIVILFLFH